MPTGTDTTSTGMPPIEPIPHALDVPPVQPTRQSPGTAARGIADEGKAQVTATLDGLAMTVRDVASRLEGNGAAPFARYVHQAADTVAGWSRSVDGKSIDELLDDARTLVRTSPAVVVGMSLVAGFVLSRLIKVTSSSGRA